jgi:hypothetical protein
MSLSALQKNFFPPIIASAAVFVAMTVPLTVIGDKDITIKYQNEPFFNGRLREISTPYVMLATALSIGAGISAVAICGWQYSSRKTAEIEKELSNLEKNLQQKEELVKELKLSDMRLQMSGLNAFLDDEMPFAPAPKISQPVVMDYPASMNSLPQVMPPISAAISLPQLAQGVQTNRQQEAVRAVASPIPISPKVEIYEQAVKTEPYFVSQPDSKQKVNSATSAFASAQSIIAYAQSNNSKQTKVSASTHKTKVPITSKEFEQLQQQMRQMMSQMQAMQQNLQYKPDSLEKPKTANFVVYYDTHN